jgi:3',5'-cyclic AMP phosphodiesterase CpdA
MSHPDRRMRLLPALALLTGCAHRGFDLHRATADLGAQPTADAAAARFVVLGDIGVWSGKGSGEGGAVTPDDLSPAFRAVAARVHAACADAPCDFAVVAGDNLYEDGIQSEDDAAALRLMVAELGLPVWFVLGNHDWHPMRPALATARAELDLLAASPDAHGEAHFWKMGAGPVVLWGLDSNLLVRFGHLAEDRWVDAFLRELAEEPSDRWRIAMAHHTWFSDGQHGDAGVYLDADLKLWRGEAYATVLEERVRPHADLYLSGHDHNLQFFDHGGVGVLVSGSGAKCNPRGTKQARFAEGRPAPAMTRFERGFAIVDATPERLAVTFHALSEGAFFTATKARGDDAWTLPDGPRVETGTRCDPRWKKGAPTEAAEPAG